MADGQYALMIDRGVYTYREAGALMNVSPARVKRWADGYTFQRKYDTGSKKPILQTERKLGVISFPELIELFFVREYVALDVKLEDVRRTAERLKERFGEFPFSHADIYVGDRQLLTPDEQGYRRADIGQLVARYAKVLKPQLEFGKNYAFIYRPKDYDGVTLNAEIGYGAPTVSKYSIPTRTIYKLWQVDQDIDSVADYHEIDPEDVVSAIQFESNVRFAAS